MKNDLRQPRTPGPLAIVLSGLLLLALWTTATDGAAAESPVLASGPIPVRDRFVLDAGFLVFEPSSPEVLERGRWRVGATASLYNSWSQSDEVRRSLEGRTSRADLTLEELREIEPRGDQRGLFHADGQIHALEVSLHRGVGRGVEIWFRGTLINASGGFTDSFVEGFHGALGIGQASRDVKDRDVYIAYLRSPDGRELYRPAGTGIDLGDIAIGARKSLGSTEGGWSHSLESAVELPTGSSRALAGSGSIDLGLRYLGELQLRRARLRGTLAAVRHGSNDAVFQESETLATLWLGYEHALGSRTSVLFQMSVGQSRYRDSNVFRLEDEVYLVDLGIKRRWRGPGLVFVALSQNFNRGSSSDFGVHLGWQRDF